MKKNYINVIFIQLIIDKFELNSVKEIILGRPWPKVLELKILLIFAIFKNVTTLD